MRLEEVLIGVAVIEIRGNRNSGISGVQIDSRKIEKNNLFLAIKGTRTDGHKFIDKAIKNGAKTIVCESVPDHVSDDVTWVKVTDSINASGFVVHNYYEKPSDQLTLIGVTGTNGKTTVATLLHQLMMQLGKKSGLISTVECRIGNSVFVSTHTTPDAVAICDLLNRMVDAECEYAFMEVSSHALDQKRVNGLHFKGAIFTNLSHDHLDYHGIFLEYIKAKKIFFDMLDTNAFALVNADDRHSKFLVQNCMAKVSKYSLQKVADYRAKILSNEIEGLHIRIDGIEMHSRLVGDFNAYNLLAVYGAAHLTGVDRDDLARVISGLKPAEGRFDMVYDPKHSISAIIDYAHTPDALEKILTTLGQVKRKGSRLIVVVGCGGDRDKAKRPVMAGIAAKLSDQAVLTSDNPRSEDPEAILDEMEEGIRDTDKSKVLRIGNRKEAIRTAVKLTQRGDIILIAGKGHEKYQEIKGKKFPFDDKKIVREAFKDI